MRFIPAKILCTLQLMLSTLFPAAEKVANAPLADGVFRCSKLQFAGGMVRFMNSNGELRLFFPSALAIAAPFLLFRLKREGFSRCSVEATEQGLFVQGRR